MTNLCHLGCKVSLGYLYFNIYISFLLYRHTQLHAQVNVWCNRQLGIIIGAIYLTVLKLLIEYGFLEVFLFMLEEILWISMCACTMFTYAFMMYIKLVCKFTLTNKLHWTRTDVECSALVASPILTTYLSQLK